MDEFRDLIRSRGGDLPIISRSSEEGIRNIEGIIAASDRIIIAGAI